MHSSRLPWQQAGQQVELFARMVMGTRGRHSFSRPRQNCCTCETLPAASRQLPAPCLPAGRQKNSLPNLCSLDTTNTARTSSTANRMTYSMKLLRL